MKDQTPLAGNFAVFLRSAPPRRDRGSVALGLLAAMAIAAALERFTRVTMMHAAWIAAGAMVVTNCCSVERAPQPRHLRAVRDKRILMVYGVGGYRFSDFVRIGVPLDLLVMALTVAIHPSLSRSDVEDLSFGPTHWLLPHGGSLVKLIAGRSRRRNL